MKEFEESGADCHRDAHDDAFAHTCNKWKKCKTVKLHLN